MLRCRIVILGSGNVVPITNLLDIAGDETDDIHAAAAVVAGPMPDGQWLACRVSEGDIERLH